MKRTTVPLVKGKSELEKFTLFFEAVPAPDYLSKTGKNLLKRSKRLSRKRK